MNGFVLNPLIRLHVGIFLNNIFRILNGTLPKQYFPVFLPIIYIVLINFNIIKLQNNLPALYDTLSMIC